MRQFHVPQFITIEDKVIGPFTIKQFLYIGGGALLIVFGYLFLEVFALIPLAVVIGSLSAALAFLKINDQPLPVILKNAVFYLIRPRIYVWKKEELRKLPPKKEVKKEETLISSIPKLSASKLSDLAWSLDIKEKVKQ